jgi:hypothetical protein
VRIIPVDNLVVTVTARKIQKRGNTRWRGHWSVYPERDHHPETAMAEGDTDLYVSEENAYLFAGTEGVAIAKDITAKFSAR